MSPLRGCHFFTKAWPHPTAYRLQCWDTSDQTTNVAGTQSLPSVYRLPKVFLSLQLPAKHTHIDTAPPPEGQDPAPPTSGQAPASLTRKLAQASQTSSTRGQAAEVRKTATLWNRNHNHRKLDKMRQQKNMSFMREQDKTPEEQLIQIEIGNIPEK